MGKGLQENEFLGEFARFCEDGGKIYFFDEVTQGLFYMHKNTYDVGLLMSPDEFASSGDFPVLQLIKSDDNLYIIPKNMKFGLRIFNIVSRQLDVIFPFERDEIIGNVTKMGSILYIIPEETNQVFAKFDITTGIAEVISDHWFDGTETKECWGYSVYSDEVVFPIIGTNEIVCFKDERIKKIKLRLDEGITSVCLDNDGLWILPESNCYIYNDDGKNRIFRINIEKEGVFACDYVRIISKNDFIILLPKTNENILMYKKKENKWIDVEKGREDKFRFLFRRIVNKGIQFWGYSFFAKKIQFMPLGYRLAELDLEREEMDFRIMNCSEGFTGEQYKKWFKQNALVSQESADRCLRDFIKYLHELLSYIQ